VARRAGVAIGTVSNVLNNPGLVAEQTRLKVEAAIAELGFVRNSAARALAARRTDTWAVISLPPTSSIEEHASWSSSPAVRICD
jgi:LacI family transcriptional regulator